MAIGGLYNVKSPLDNAMQGMQTAANSYASMTKKIETKGPDKSAGGALMGGVGGAAMGASVASSALAGTAITPGIGTAIGAGVGLLAYLLG
jgi:hypothetical protein